MTSQSVACVAIKKVNEASISDADDMLAAEEPLEIRLVYGPPDKRMQKSISVTMRTPGNDFELAAGFLFTEGIISNQREISSVTHCNRPYDNVVKVELDTAILPAVQKLERNFYTTSSCGVCGKSSIESVRTVCNYPPSKDDIHISSQLICSLPALLRQEQELFKYTGGIHACALFDLQGHLIVMREDVGRHNALDKLAGAALSDSLLPLDKHILLLSGRTSFELIQKAMMAGIRCVAAIGAPSTLAVEMAKETDMTLIGFLRGAHFNIYSGAQRIAV